jgi:mono/diheme cytochrome c family protein
VRGRPLPPAALAALLLGASLGALSALAAGCAPRDRSATGLYRAYCARCHGPAGEGTPRALRASPQANLTVSEPVRRGDRRFLRERIANGYGIMPGYAKRLTRQEIDSLVDLTLELQKRQTTNPGK